MMPNVPQYPVAVAAVLRAGLHGGQRQPALHAARAGAPAQGFGRQGHRHHRELRAHAAAGASATTPVKHVVLAAMGDLLGLPKGALVNYVVRNVKKMVPAFEPARRGALQRRARGRRPRARSQAGRDRPRRRRGAAVHRRHHRRVARARCCCIATSSPTCCSPKPGTSRRCSKVPAGEQPTSVCALPLYHIFALHGRA